MKKVLLFFLIMFFPLFANAETEFGSIATVNVIWPPDTQPITPEPKCIPTGSGYPDLKPIAIMNLTDETPHSITMITIAIDTLQNAGIQLIKIYRDDDLIGYTNCYGMKTCTFIKTIFERNREAHNYYAKVYDNKCQETKSKIIEAAKPEIEPECIPTGSGYPDLKPLASISYTDETANSTIIAITAIDTLQNAGVQLIKIYKNNDFIGYGKCYGVRICTLTKLILFETAETLSYYAKVYDNKCQETTSEIISLPTPKEAKEKGITLNPVPVPPLTEEETKETSDIFSLTPEKQEEPEAEKTNIIDKTQETEKRKKDRSSSLSNIVGNFIKGITEIDYGKETEEVKPTPVFRIIRKFKEDKLDTTIILAEIFIIIILISTIIAILKKKK